VTAADSISHVLLHYVKRNIAANKAHILHLHATIPMFP